MLLLRQTNLKEVRQVLASQGWTPAANVCCQNFFWMYATSTKIGDVEAGCNIFTHLAFMSYYMSVSHLAVMFTCGATRTNQDMYPHAFGRERTNSPNSQ